MAKKVIRLNESQLRRMIKESVKRALNEGINELSPVFLKKAMEKFKDKYTPTKNNNWDHSTYTSLDSDEFGNRVHPKDKRPITKHLFDFSQAISKAKKDMPFDETLDAKAQELYKTIEFGDWEDLDMVDHYEHGYGYVVGEAGVTDNDGQEWIFRAGGDGHYEGGWLEFDDIDEVEYEAPNGQEGSIQNP